MSLPVCRNVLRTVAIFLLLSGIKGNSWMAWCESRSFGVGPSIEFWGRSGYRNTNGETGRPLGFQGLFFSGFARCERREHGAADSLMGLCRVIPACICRPGWREGWSLATIPLGEVQMRAWLAVVRGTGTKAGNQGLRIPLPGVPEGARTAPRFSPRGLRAERGEKGPSGPPMRRVRMSGPRHDAAGGVGADVAAEGLQGALPRPRMGRGTGNECGQRVSGRQAGVSRRLSAKRTPKGDGWRPPTRGRRAAPDGRSGQPARGGSPQRRRVERADAEGQAEPGP